MASPAREEKQKQAYEGLGAGGKIRKTPFRRTTQETPYDRPPTILRNPLEPPTMAGSRSSSIRLSASSPPVPTANAFLRFSRLRQDVSGVLKGTIDQCSDPSHPSPTDDGGKLTDLEQILEQKTFTRSESDRLTALLHSRTVDMPVENLEKRSEGIPSKSAVSHDRKEEFPKTPLRTKRGLIAASSNPVVSTSILDEDVASPAELAKAYMGSRPSKVSLSMLDARDFTSQKQDKVRENGPLRIGALSGSSTTLTNGADSATEKKDILLNVKTTVSAASNSVHPPKKKCAFKMSAHEDFLDLDDDDNSNGVASDSRGKSDATSTKNIPVYSEVKTSASPTVFAASWQPGKSPVFATAFNSTSSSTGLSYVASSVAPATNSAPIVSRGSSVAATTSTNNVPFVFGGSSTAAATTNNVPSVFGGSLSAAATTINAPITFGGSTVSSTNNNSGSLFRSSNGASSTSMFSFTSTALTSAPSQPPSGNSNPVFPFGSPGNNEQMNMEDSMAEDTNQASTPTAPGFGQQFQFGQQPILNSQSASVFGGTPTAPAVSPFQFAGQQNLTNPQNPNPFQASGSLGANQGLGGSFSVGSSGGDGDKSQRRIIKVKRIRGNQNPNPFQASGSLGANQGLGGSFSVGSSGGDGDKSQRRIIRPRKN